jgi:hypothetical protein
MDRQPHDFLQQFGSMNTDLLLQRYRTGGLVPEAEAALLSVLESRGYSHEALVRKKTATPSSNGGPPALRPGKPAPIPRIHASHPDLRRFNLALKCLVAPVLIVFILLAIPLLGNFIVIGGAGLLGCQTGENHVHPCHFLGWDIGEFVYGYVVDIFVLGGANPFLAGVALLAFLRSPFGVAWLLLIGGTYGAREIRRWRITKPNGPGDRQRSS